jgi:hypothetical protein
MGKETVERAEAGCFATCGVELKVWLKDAIGSFADLGLAKRGNKPTSLGSDDDQQWLTWLSQHAETLPDGIELTVYELFAAVTSGPAGEVRRADHTDLIRVGRVMKRLRWPRRQILRDGRRTWVYVKPLLVDEIAPPTQGPESTPPEQPAAPVIPLEPRKPTYEEKLVAEAREKLLLVQAQRRREWAEKHRPDG